MNQQLATALTASNLPAAAVDEIIRKFNRLEKLEEAVGWVVRDAMYRAPESMTLPIVQNYIAKLQEAVRL